ncbi:apolipoprotein N-acyltransferase [Mycobacterium sp. CBMA293]|uniref:apolipoprotein N-acyltransferase n=1 Tax=unclassified Mycolicibacterium TaxID=2636767 RepID=UPI0012DD82D0|nr:MULTISPECIES: apolipoprotein N-acyltransferase [unclassified Mycolicibacterium]MUL45303.1 apolipoprotein N-acyltransferase [Mycolicibacterium sp. CBMA 360]MUL56823.1 apolipoprotein N-acyltransferase [Mycolicibacterium sp. CBMA 335]MUL69862.1 apolipoprotein N-acyltransferase [Mycolicibacterium sp. CBMA 311]MUL91910.1 apolipoprotein N-acyltransferase [Mycolicibacterium sp. CBMA 230]MUM05649.1 apolipoprotein N-acyltransferase [Mycolicibacterium sp. CBMA 213]
MAEGREGLEASEATLDETRDDSQEDSQEGGREDDAQDAGAATGPGRGARIVARLRRFFEPRLIRLALAVVAGLLLAASFPPFDFWYLAFPAMALLAWILIDERTTPAGGFGYGMLAGQVFYVLLLPWISNFVGPLPWVMLAALEAFFVGVFGLAAVLVRRLRGWPVWFAALWVGAEWLKSTVPFGGFPWGVVAFGQTSGPLLPLAQVGGAPLVSFAVALVGFSALAIVLEAVKRWRHDHRTGAGAPPAVFVPGACIAVILLLIVIAWPHVRKSGAGAGDDPAINVAAVQGNVPRLGLDFNAQRRAVLDNHVHETKVLAEDVRAGRAPQPTVVIWPENSSDIDPLANADAAELISAASSAIQAPILVGTVLTAPDYTPEHPTTTNSVIVWDGTNGPGDRHDKAIVQPFGEYLPWRSFFRLLSPYADRAGYFVPGTGSGVVTAAGVPIGVTTCWEVIFDRAARQSVLGGAQLLAVPANNATFDEPMSLQQLAFARLRAVEHDRYVIVAGTTGVSAVVAPDGHVIARTEFFEPAYLDRQVRLKTDLTLATRWGPAVNVVLVGVGVAALLVGMRHNRNLVRRRKAVAGIQAGNEAGADAAAEAENEQGL